MKCKVVKLNDNIYLINNEKIQVGDWVYPAFNRHPKTIWEFKGGVEIFNKDKKIIATNNVIFYCNEIVITPVEKVQEILSCDYWWDNLTTESKNELFNRYSNIYD